MDGSWPSLEGEKEMCKNQIDIPFLNEVESHSGEKVYMSQTFRLNEKTTVKAVCLDSSSNQ